MKIQLINMPFASLSIPSIAMTQLKAVTDAAFGGRVETGLHYLNHEFAAYMGTELYAFMSESLDAHNAGLGDWLFRQAAFPELPDNTEEYFARYFPYHNEQVEALKGLVLEKRRGLAAFLDGLVDSHGFDHADAVGFTSMFNQNIAIFSLARRIKERNPRIVVMMGGANCETPMGQEIVRNVEAIDYVFSGPALKSFPEFVGHLLEGEPEKCERIRGLFTKRNYASQPADTAIGEELDINAEVRLDYDKFLASLDRHFPAGEVKPVLLFETSRGCWWGQKAHCTFCGLNGTTMAYRAMEPDRALAQFDEIFRYAPRVERFDSVDNILPKEYVSQVFPRLDVPKDAYLFYEVKADLSEEDMRVLAKARVRLVQPGIEALATSTLKLMKKGTTAFQNVSFLKYCLTCDVYPFWNLLVGFPGEEEEVYRKYVADIPSLLHLPPPNGSFPVRFDRYSPYFTRAREYGLDLQPVDYYELGYPFPQESLANMAYYFQDRNVGAKYVGTMTRWIGKIREGVGLWQRRWQGQDGLLPPKLHFKEDSDVVYDSRAGRAVEHRVGEAGREIIGFLSERPARVSSVASALNRPGLDFEREVAALTEKGLLFREGDRYLSLVLSKEAPPMSALSHV